MKHKQMKWTALWAWLSLLAMASTCLADDSAAAIAAGGLVARRETRIVMAREVLKISPAKVVVDYDFRNDSDEDVTTEVAFPIPPYENWPNELPAENASFSDFALIVDGKTVRYQADARAFLKGAEVTSVLRADKIDIATFGHWDWKNDRAPELARLPKLEQNRLVKAGLFDSDEPWGNWTVRLQYHWTQIFRAHSTVHIRHEYTPNYGFEMMPRATIRKALHEPPTPGDDAPQTTAADTKLLNSFCPDAGFLHSLEKGMSGPRAEDSYTHTLD